MDIRPKLSYLFKEIKTNGSANFLVNGVTYNAYWKGSTLKACKVSKHNTIFHRMLDSIPSFLRKKTSDRLVQALMQDKELDNYLPRAIEGNTKKQYEAICFAGGGAKGTGYAGVIAALGNDRLHPIKEVAGASAGALVAAMVTTGADADEIIECMKNMKVELNQKAMKTSFQTAFTGLLNKHRYAIAQVLMDKKAPLKKEDGTLVKPDRVREEDLANLTFRQLQVLSTAQELSHLHIKRLMVTGTLTNKKENYVSEVLFSDKTTPDIPICQAVIASASIPIKLPPMKFRYGELFQDHKPTGNDKDRDSQEAQHEQTLLVRDGGIRNNLPHRYFSDNIGQRLVLSFEPFRSLEYKKVSFIDKVKQFLVGDSFCELSKADYYAANADKRCTHYYVDSGLSTFAIKKAKREFDKIKSKVREDFIEFEGRNTPASSDEFMYDKTFNELKYGHKKWGHSLPEDVIDNKDSRMP